MPRKKSQVAVPKEIVTRAPRIRTRRQTKIENEAKTSIDPDQVANTPIMESVEPVHSTDSVPIVIVPESLPVVEENRRSADEVDDHQTSGEQLERTPLATQDNDSPESATESSDNGPSSHPEAMQVDGPSEECSETAVVDESATESHSISKTEMKVEVEKEAASPEEVTPLDSIEMVIEKPPDLPAEPSAVDVEELKSAVANIKLEEVSSSESKTEIIKVDEASAEEVMHIAEQKMFTAVQEMPSTVEEKPTAVQEMPSTVEENPTAVQENPTTVEEKPTAVQEMLTAKQEKPTSDAALAKEEQPTADVVAGEGDKPPPTPGSVATQSGSTSDGEKDSNIRRSSRIKTISKSKQKSRGHGLVRDREKIKLIENGGGLCSSPAEPSTNNKSQPAKEDLVPRKIKSRWLDSAKRDIQEGTMNLGDANLGSTDTNPAVGNSGPQPILYHSDAAMDKVVEERLKQFLTIRENIYSCDKNISKEAKKMICDCFLTQEEKEFGELGCGEDCLNRLLMIECGPRCVVSDRCTNRRFQKFQYAACKVFRTEKKGFGIMATSTIYPGDFIMEYVGEVLNAKQFDKRANTYSKDKNKHYYFMALRSDAVIDATLKGNISRFINHSCDPNAETQKWTVNGELRIGFFCTRTVVSGEEITFDYQYQRYGKEAQKCYCESENCRGWIGEEPDSGTDEADDEEESEGESSDGEEVEGEPKKDDELSSTASSKGKVPLLVATAKKERKPRTPKVKPITAPASVVRKPKTKSPRRKNRRQEILDDLDLDAEIDALQRTGLKNQAHTLKLSRLMVRSKLVKTRSRLLELLQGAELPCRRLFLDYHGLKLLNGWMNDCQEQQDAVFRRELLHTLTVLPIPNKTMLKDSHVLVTVAKWGDLKMDQEMKEIESPETDAEADAGRKVKEEEVVAAAAAAAAAAVVTVDAAVAPAVPVEIKMEEGDEKTPTSNATTEIPNLDEEIKQSSRSLCKELCEKWMQLPEVFRIPKKERIEQMKEHEREADMRGMTLGLTTEEENQSRNRYKNREDPKPKKDYQNKSSSRQQQQQQQQQQQDGNGGGGGLSKNQRRRLFAMQAENQQREKQRMDAWTHHEFRCGFFGLDPYQVRPEDVPSWVDLETRQWFTYDLTEVPIPPSYSHIAMKPTAKAKIDDYNIPAVDLPEGWQYAMDGRGRLYYFHSKIRIPQWEVPIKLLPLNEEAGQRQQDGESNGMAAKKADDDGPTSASTGGGGGGGEDKGQDSSTTDTCDSSEEETVKKINRIKKLQKLGVPHSTIVKLHLYEKDSDDEVTRVEVGKIEAGKSGPSSGGHRLLNREALVEFREISPRRDEDRLYGQMEMKRYRETKEKFRRRKEMLKRRKLDKLIRAGAFGNSDQPDKRISLRGIQISNDELYDETDDEQQGDQEEKQRSSGAANEEQQQQQQSKPEEIMLKLCDAAAIAATTSDPLMEKIVLGTSRVDELDEPLKYNEMTKLKIREKNAKRKRALKVQLKLKKLKAAEEQNGVVASGSHRSDHHHHHHSTSSSHHHQHGQVGESSSHSSSSNGLAVSQAMASATAVPISNEKAKRIKDKFRMNIAGVIVQHLSPYRKDSCRVGRIMSNDDFKHLARKLTHFVLVKELKHCATVAELSVSESVKQKSKEFIRKYMTKYGDVYQKPDNDPDY